MTILYVSAKDVSDFLLLRSAFDANSAISRGKIEAYIVRAMGEFERRTGEAYRPILVTDEIFDLQAVRSRFPEIFEALTVPRPIHLNNRPIIPFDAARGHKVEVYQGEEPWTNWLLKTEGRNQDWWLDAEKGIFFLRKAFIPRRNALVRTTYEWGFLQTQLNGALTDSATTITVDSTNKYQTHGVVRIGEEYIFYTGKTTTTLTGCSRGEYDTSAVAHNDDDFVIQVPDSVRSMIVKKAALEFLMNERFVAEAAEGSGAAVIIAKVIDDLRDDWERALSGEYNRWEVF